MLQLKYALCHRFLPRDARHCIPTPNRHCSCRSFRSPPLVIPPPIPPHLHPPFPRLRLILSRKRGPQQPPTNSRRFPAGHPWRQWRWQEDSAGHPHKKREGMAKKKET
ncbi:hypothetical protein CEXT_57991 [Caerostris extrusa]|uniref:Uncharacterized protein n=1 Tax=Caerostris extrusa TaxID=172846 RepID=A0AAV4QXD5_CAEEX|nr:hypothetical protein CEXT_57991 [Caerostris extrusa]